MAQSHVNAMLNSLTRSTFKQAAKFKSVPSRFSFEVSITYSAPKGKVTLLTAYNKRRVGTQYVTKAQVKAEQQRWLSGKYDATVAIMSL